MKSCSFHRAYLPHHLSSIFSSTFRTRKRTSLPFQRTLGVSKTCLYVQGTGVSACSLWVKQEVDSKHTHPIPVVLEVLYPPLKSTFNTKQTMKCRSHFFLFVLMAFREDRKQLSRNCSCTLLYLCLPVLLVQLSVNSEEQGYPSSLVAISLQISKISSLLKGAVRFFRAVKKRRCSPLRHQPHCLCVFGSSFSFLQREHA